MTTSWKAEEIHHRLEDATCEEFLVEFFTSTDDQDRQRMCSEYAQLYDDTLVAAISRRTFGHLERTLLTLLEPRVPADARHVRTSLQQGAEDGVVVEVLITRTLHHIEKVKAEYQEQYHSTMEKDIKANTKEEFQRMLLALVAATNKESHQTWSEYTVSAEAGEGSSSASEYVDLVRILTAQSAVDLNSHVAMLKKYNAVTQMNATEANFLQGTPGLVSKIMLAVIEPAEFMADQLFEARKGIGRDEDAFLRIVSCSQYGYLTDARTCYQKRYGESLAIYVEENSTGAYQEILLRFLLRDAPLLVDMRFAFTKNSVPHALKVLRCLDSHKQAIALTKLYDAEFSTNLFADGLAKFGDSVAARTFISAVLSTSFSAHRIYKGLSSSSGGKQQTTMEALTSLDRDSFELVSKEFEKISGGKKMVQDAIVDAFAGDLETAFVKIAESKTAEFPPKRSVNVEAVAQNLHDQLHRNNDIALIDMCTSYDRETIAAVGEAYKSKFGIGLEKLAVDELTGDLESMALGLLDVDKYCTGLVFRACTHNDIELLSHALGVRSKARLKALDTAFEAKYRHSLQQYLSKELNDPLLIQLVSAFLPE
eukprot:TRINITY_DN61144_c0_g1_i1.p1 TRINITY_DN61144_c0_g1~~TRINITY_DN61144_c0_g1_i1.p1  ORF type:complete len:611 (-),score=52.30 TRINITY_DN61144_c0_g1_i1:82-1866(-)